MERSQLITHNIKILKTFLHHPTFDPTRYDNSLIRSAVEKQGDPEAVILLFDDPRFRTALEDGFFFQLAVKNHYDNARLLDYFLLDPVLQPTIASGKYDPYLLDIASIRTSSGLRFPHQMMTDQSLHPNLTI